MENSSDYYIGNWHDKQYKEELKELTKNLKLDQEFGDISS
jgi:hypothetical protein